MTTDLDFCPECGAYWFCEHRVINDGGYGGFELTDGDLRLGIEHYVFEPLFSKKR